MGKIRNIPYSPHVQMLWEPTTERLILIFHHFPWGYPTFSQKKPATVRWLTPRNNSWRRRSQWCSDALHQTELQGVAIASRWTLPRKTEVGKDVHVEHSWVSVSAFKLYHQNVCFIKLYILGKLGSFSHSRSGLTVEFQGELVGFGAWIMKTIHGRIPRKPYQEDL